MADNLPTIYTRDLIREIAMDIGKEVVHYMETMYPDMFKAVSKNAKLSVRNCVHNEIIAAIKVNDAGQIEARLQRRKQQRKYIKKMLKVKTIEEFNEAQKDKPIYG